MSSSASTCPPRTDVAAVPLRSLFEPHLSEIKRLMRVVESETFFESRSVLAVGDPLDVACAASNFGERTFLVTVARMIVAATVHGTDVDTDRLVAAIDGGDCFCGWLTEFDAGVDFLERLADVVVQVDWRAADRDVLKGLYHDLIGSADRKELGEFYTPDWLAADVVQRTLLHDPSRLDEAIETAALALDSTTALSEGDDQAYRILDPACGSGTFLFCAAKTVAERVRSTHPQLTSRIREIVAAMVTGIDINPVAVEMAKATLSTALPSGVDVPLQIFHADALHPSLSLQTSIKAAYILANPPWLVPNSPAAGNIKAEIVALAQQYKLHPQVRSSAKTDLAAVFTARIVDLYLEDGGKFGLVLPGSAVTSQTWSVWRSGNWGDIKANFEYVANLNEIEPAPFRHAPNGTSVVIGQRHKQDRDTAGTADTADSADSADTAGTADTADTVNTADTADTVNRWLAATHVRYAGAASNPTITAVKQFNSAPSPYATKFRRGAVASPLGLCLVLDCSILPVTSESSCSADTQSSADTSNPQSTVRVSRKPSNAPKLSDTSSAHSDSHNLQNPLNRLNSPDTPHSLPQDPDSPIPHSLSPKPSNAPTSPDTAPQTPQNTSNTPNQPDTPDIPNPPNTVSAAQGTQYPPNCTHSQDSQNTQTPQHPPTPQDSPSMPTTSQNTQTQPKLLHSPTQPDTSGNTTLPNPSYNLTQPSPQNSPNTPNSQGTSSTSQPPTSQHPLLQPPQNPQNSLNPQETLLSLRQQDTQNPQTLQVPQIPLSQYPLSQNPQNLQDTSNKSQNSNPQTPPNPPDTPHPPDTLNPPDTPHPPNIPTQPDDSSTSPHTPNPAPTLITPTTPNSFDRSTVQITTKTSTKPPWVGVGYNAVIETAALLRVLRAQTLRPFKCSPDAWMIAPLSQDRQRILELDDPEFAATLPHTHAYWTIAEAHYQQNRAETAGVTLSQNIDRHQTLTKQLKQGTSQQQTKVFYNKSGNTLRASRGPTTLIADDKLYWHIATTTEEALYLTGILNADSLQNAWQQTKTSKLHYDLNPLKHVPIPQYDPKSVLHTQIVNTTHHIEQRQTPPPALKQTLEQAVTKLLPDHTT